MTEAAPKLFIFALLCYNESNSPKKGWYQHGKANQIEEKGCRSRRGVHR